MDEEELHLALLLDGEGEGEIAGGVEGDADLGALGAHHRTLEQAVEDVQDHRVVPLLVVGPRLHGHLGVRLPVAVAHLDVGLLLDPVEVLVEAVQEEGEELLAVLQQ